jgi:hypothetical protein
MRRVKAICASIVLSVALVGCATQKPFDYSAFRAHRPRSILVLPPINNSPDVKGTYGYLSTVTRPIAEKGYYVFPVMLVDKYMRDNGLETATDMQDVPLSKIRDIFGADAVLYVDLKDYGTTFALINSTTTVSASAKLIDTRTGIQLWKGSATVSQGSSAASAANPLAALIADAVGAVIDQIVNTSTDHAHLVSKLVNAQLFTNPKRGLLKGPYAVEK